MQQCTVQVHKNQLWMQHRCLSLHARPCPSPVGMEVAASLSSKAASVTCIDLLEVPFIQILGAKVGAAIQKVSGRVHVRVCM